MAKRLPLPGIPSRQFVEGFGEMIKPRGYQLCKSEIVVFGDFSNNFSDNSPYFISYSKHRCKTRMQCNLKNVDRTYSKVEKPRKINWSQIWHSTLYSLVKYNWYSCFNTTLIWHLAKGNIYLLYHTSSFVLVSGAFMIQGFYVQRSANVLSIH